MQLKVTQIGNSLGVVLPKELLAQLKVEKGDTLHVLEGRDGITLTAFDPEFADRMDRVDRLMRENRNLLKRLAE